MKQRIFNLFVVSSFIILFIEVLLNKSLVFETISYSLEIWVNNLVPTMFPFFIISDILISYHITNYIPKFLKKYLKSIFNVSEQCISIFLLSIFSGFPAGARNVRTLYDKKLISSSEANRILMFNHFANPLFVLGTVGVLFLNNELYGYLILLSHYMGNIIVGILFRNIYYSDNINYKLVIDKSQNFSSVLIKAIKSSIDTLLLILGTLTCFLIISSLIINKINVNCYLDAIIKGILEMTMGLKSISLLHIDPVYKVVISTMFISFGGFAVHLQVLSQLVDTNISYRPFLLARMLHALISGGIGYVLYCFFSI